MSFWAAALGGALGCLIVIILVAAVYGIKCWLEDH